MVLYSWMASDVYLQSTAKECRPFGTTTTRPLSHQEGVSQPVWHLESEMETGMNLKLWTLYTMWLIQTTGDKPKGWSIEGDLGMKDIDWP